MKKKCLALLLALLLMSVPTLAEGDPFLDLLGDGDDFDEDLSFMFDDSGYTGTWTDIEALNMEFCLPDGWHTEPAEEGEAYCAESEFGDVRMTLSVEQDLVEDLVAYAEANLPGYHAADAGLYDAVVTEDDASLTVRFLDEAGELLAFRFERTTPEAIDETFALQIAGTCYEIWDGEDFDFGDEWDDQDDSDDFLDVFAEG